MPSGALALAIGSVLVLTTMALASEIGVDVTEHAGVSRDDWPVTGGVPFARGAVKDAGNVRLFDDSGQLVRLQREVMAWWDDGSIKWLLLDFFATVDANVTRVYTLRYGDGVQPATESRLRWRKTERGVSVDTGCLRAEISNRLFESLSVKQEDGSWADVVTGPGEMWMSANGEKEGRYSSALGREGEVVVEQSGPNRVCVRVSGWHYDEKGQRFGAYVLRVHAYAGRPYLRVFHTFINSEFPEDSLITGIGMRVRFSADGESDVCYGGTERRRTAGEPCWLAQPDSERQEIVHDGEALASERQADGFLSVSGKQDSVACFLRDWRQLCPKKLEVDADGLSVWLWPASEGALDLRREEQKQSEGWLQFKKDFPKTFAEWNDPGTARSAGISARRYRVAARRGDRVLMAISNAFGLARTHEMWFVFSPESIAADSLKQFSAAVNEPLLPFVDPRYMNETEVLGPFGWQDRENFPRAENYLLRKLDWIIRHQNEWSRWLGILDWGGLRSIYERIREVHTPGQWIKYMGRHGWRNSEVDTPVHFMYHYLRTGQRRLWRFFESTVRHQMDVDTIHLNLPEFDESSHEWEERQWIRGGQHRHSYNHYSGGANMGHTWNESIVNYYFLTGDRRAYDVAVEVGEYSLGSPEPERWGWFKKWTAHANDSVRFGRDASNPYRNLLKCYEMTGEERWLREAMKWRQHFLAHKEDYLQRVKPTYLVTTYLVRTFALDYYMFRDRVIADELARIAHWQLDFQRRGYKERGLLYCYLASGLAWWATRDDELLRWTWHTYLPGCMSPVGKAQKHNDFSKGDFYELGQLPFFLRACQEAGYSEAKPPEPLPASRE